MPPDDHSELAARVSHAAALARQADEWTEILPDTEMGTLDTVGRLADEQVPELHSRSVALTAQRVRMLSAELSRDFSKRGRAALVREDLMWDPEAGAPVVAREAPTALAALEGKERDRLSRELLSVIRLRLEMRSIREREEQAALASSERRRAEREEQAVLLSLVARAALEVAGHDWAAPETQRLAQRALSRARELKDGTS